MPDDLVNLTATAGTIQATLVLASATHFRSPSRPVCRRLSWGVRVEVANTLLVATTLQRTVVASLRLYNARLHVFGVQNH